MNHNPAKHKHKTSMSFACYNNEEHETWYSNIQIRTRCKLQSLFYLTTALHVLGITITHLQEHKTTVTTASGNHYTVLLSAAIVEELGLIK